MSVAAEIRAELARQNMNASELAQALGVTKQTMSKKLRKERSDFHLKELNKISDFLNVPAWELVKRAEEQDGEA